MTFEQFEKATKRDLKSAARSCFDLANEPQTLNDMQVAKLLESQFYMQELDRRDESWVQRRDFWLEVIVIVLILGESVLSIYGIRLAIKEGNDENALMNKQDQILGNLETSTRATAALVQEQLDVEYGLSINPEYNGSDSIALYNNSRSPLSIGGIQIGTLRPSIKASTQTVVPDHNMARIDFIDYVPHFVDILRPNAKPVIFPIEIYIKNARGEEFVWSGKVRTGEPSGNSAGRTNGTLSKQKWSNVVRIETIP